MSTNTVFSSSIKSLNISALTCIPLLVTSKVSSFNPSATINVNINQIINNAEIQVYDINGKLIDKLYSGSFTPGNYSFTWNPDNISSGKYFIRFKSKDFTRVKEIVYIK